MVAHRLDTTEQMIENYLRNTSDKLGVWSRLEFALKWPAMVAQNGKAI